MSVGYVTVQWNRHKRIYDGVAVGAIILYLGMFVFVGKLMFRGSHALSDEVLILRALGSCAFLMLTSVLCIGPLARLDRRVLPLLYNRRHLGVMTFAVAFLHGAIATGYYHGFGKLNPLVSLLTTNTNFTSLRAFPFQVLGVVALVILFLMASTSHDFWNRNLSARAWKWLHMMVYPAYALVVLHVALGALQTQRSWWLASAMLVCVGGVGLVHLLAAWKEAPIDRGDSLTTIGSNELDAGSVDPLTEGHGRVVCAAGGERIAVFRANGAFAAITNVCVHQGGPLGEGRIIDGCVTCPWHGWQYRPEDGQSPPPFEEKIATHRVRLEERKIRVDVRSLPPGTRVEAARQEDLADG